MRRGKDARFELRQRAEGSQAAATLMLSRGVHPKLVSELLGHSSIGITLDLYSHVIPTMHREAARVMDELLGPQQ